MAYILGGLIWAFTPFGSRVGVYFDAYWAGCLIDWWPTPRYYIFVGVSLLQLRSRTFLDLLQKKLELKFGDVERIKLTCDN